MNRSNTVNIDNQQSLRFCMIRQNSQNLLSFFISRKPNNGLNKPFLCFCRRRKRTKTTRVLYCVLHSARLEQCGDMIQRLFVCLLNGMGIEIQRGTGLTVTEHSRHSFDINAVR